MTVKIVKYYLKGEDEHFLRTVNDHDYEIGQMFELGDFYAIVTDIFIENSTTQRRESLGVEFEKIPPASYANGNIYVDKYSNVLSR